LLPVLRGHDGVAKPRGLESEMYYLEKADCTFICTSVEQDTVELHWLLRPT